MASTPGWRLSGKEISGTLDRRGSRTCGSQSAPPITVLELETGVPRVERRDPVQGAMLRTWMDNHVSPEFAGRVLPVNTEVARRCAGLHVPDPRSERDALIAATALVHGMTVVTRNLANFEPTGVTLLNPWNN